MTVVRRLGGDLFVLAEDICRGEQKAVVSLTAAIMTVAVTYEKDNKITEQSHLKDDEFAAMTG